MCMNRATSMRFGAAAFLSLMIITGQIDLWPIAWCMAVGVLVYLALSGDL